jgi:cytochrome c nitrite reductase small subunit
VARAKFPIDFVKAVIYACLKMKFRFSTVLKLVIAFAVLFVLIFFWPVNLYHKTSTPEFCSSCHVMQTQHDAWIKTAVHRNIDCVKCHLPYSDPLAHLFWKGYDGIKDVIFFYGRFYGDRIETSGHGVNTIQKNCVRCHQNMVSMMDTDSRNCWSCHRRMNHNFPASGNEIFISKE